MIKRVEYLKDIIGQLQAVCHELRLDFDLALDKSDDSDGELPTNCDHQLGYPCAGGSVYCPQCKEYIVKGNPEEIKKRQGCGVFPDTSFLIFKAPYCAKPWN